MSLRLVCSDLDGTLAATREANYAAYAAALAEHGVDFDHATFLTTWGQDARDFLPRVAPGLSPAEHLRVRERKAQLYPEHVGAVAVNRPLVTTIRGLRAAGAATALVTTAKRPNAEAVLRHHRLADLFDHLVVGDDVQRGKPHPEAYLTALERAGCRADEALTFEDSPTGLRSAAAAGIPAVTVVFDG